MTDDCDIIGDMEMFYNYPNARYAKFISDEDRDQSEVLRKELMEFAIELRKKDPCLEDFGFDTFLDCRLLYHATCDAKSLDNLVQRKTDAGLLGFSTGRVAGETMIACIEPLRNRAREKLRIIDYYKKRGEKFSENRWRGEKISEEDEQELTLSLEEKAVLSEEGMVIFEFCGKWLDYQNPIHKAYIDRMHDKYGKKSMEKLIEKGVDAVDWWNSIGRDHEFHILTPEKTLRKMEFIPTKVHGNRYAKERREEKTVNTKREKNLNIEGYK